jgi:hypothetical protein
MKGGEGVEIICLEHIVLFDCVWEHGIYETVNKFNKFLRISKVTFKIESLNIV